MDNFVREVWMLGVAGLGLAMVAYGVMGIRRMTDAGAKKVEEEGEILTLHSMILAGATATIFSALMTGTTIYVSVGVVLLIASVAMIFPRSGRMIDVFKALLPRRHKTVGRLGEHGASPHTL